jgi:hypothetical protein
MAEFAQAGRAAAQVINIPIPIRCGELLLVPSNRCEARAVATCSGPTAGAKRHGSSEHSMLACSPANARAGGGAGSRAQANRCVRRSCSETDASAGVALECRLLSIMWAGELRRIDRGLYDRPKLNSLTKRPTTPDYRAVVEAIASRDQLRTGAALVEGHFDFRARSYSEQADQGAGRPRTRRRDPPGSARWFQRVAERDT